MALHPSFLKNQFIFRRKVLKIFGGAFHVYDENEHLLLFSEQAAFRLREDVRIYADEQKTQELLTINADQIFDFGATYHVHDGQTHERVGSLRRKALRSILKDEWLLLGGEGMEIGILTESSYGAALLSRFINIIPQSYVILTNSGSRVAEIKQLFNPFVLKYRLLIVKPKPEIDRRLLVAAGILLACIERRQGQ